MYFFTSHLSNQGKYWSFFYTHYLIKIQVKDIQANIILLFMYFFTYHFKYSM